MSYIFDSCLEVRRQIALSIAIGVLVGRGHATGAATALARDPADSAERAGHQWDSREQMLVPLTGNDVPILPHRAEIKHCSRSSAAERTEGVF